MRSERVFAVAIGFLMILSACTSHHTTDPGAASGEMDKAASFKGSHNMVWSQGKHYRLIPNVTPPTRNDPNVEVIEFFEYGCGHCYVLEPWVVAWERTKPAFIRFVRVPVTYEPDYVAHAQLFYTLKELGRINVTDATDVHHEVFDTIHRMGQILLVYGDAGKSEAVQIDFAARFGISAPVFEATYRSRQVSEDLREAREAVETFGIHATPTFVVGRQYLTDAGLAGGGDHLIVLLTDLARRVQSAH